MFGGDIDFGLELVCESDASACFADNPGGDFTFATGIGVKNPTFNLIRDSGRPVLRQCVSPLPVSVKDYGRAVQTLFKLPFKTTFLLLRERSLKVSLARVYFALVRKSRDWLVSGWLIAAVQKIVGDVRGCLAPGQPIIVVQLCSVWICHSSL